MKIATQSLATEWPAITDSMLNPIIAISLEETQREREGKLFQGRKTYTSGAMLRVKNSDGSIRNDRNASIHVVEPKVYPAGTLLVSEGLVALTAYQNDAKRQCWSIVVERFVPVEPDTNDGGEPASTNANGQKG